MVPRAVSGNRGRDRGQARPLLPSGGRHISPGMGDHDSPQHLTGMLLVAMPTMPDPRFARSVIYLCAHSPEGASGPGPTGTVGNSSCAT